MSNAVALIKEKSERIAIFDLLKFILSILVVAIHSQLFPYVLFPWLRLAVPLFFVTSSYFFFTKIKNATNQKDKNLILIKYVKRNLILYLFYFLLLLPYTLYIRNYFANGILVGLITILRSFLFASTFTASWYIQATISATIIVFVVSKKLNNAIILILSAIIYILVCFRSSYWNIFSSNEIVLKIYSLYETFFCSPIFSAPAALFWIALGKYFSDYNVNMKKKFSVVAFVLSVILLYVEWLVVKKLNGSYRNDCYIFLMPICFFVFCIIKNINIKTHPVFSVLGKISVITYTTHSVVVTVVSYLFRHLFSIENTTLVFITVTFLCMVESLIILNLEKYKYFKWLKYAH